MSSFVSTSRGHNYVSCANTLAESRWTARPLAQMSLRSPARIADGASLELFCPGTAWASQLGWQCPACLHLIQPLGSDPHSTEVQWPHCLET